MARAVKRVSFAVGIELIGGKFDCSASPNMTLKELAHGIEMFSSLSQRTIVVPWANCKAYEIVDTEAPVIARRKR